jgi:hypothetical protein
MSMMDSGLDMASMFSPLRRSLIRGPMPWQQPLDVQNPAQRLRAAQQLAVARRQRGQGQSGSHPTQGMGGTSPLTEAVSKAKALVLNSVVGQDAPEELQSLRDNPNVDLQSFEHLVKIWHAANPQQHTFAPAADPNAGTISMTQGSGKRLGPDGKPMPVVSRQSLNRTAGAMSQGMQPGERIALNPNGNGFNITGAGAPQQADPIVSMVNAFRGHVPDEILAGAAQAINSGMNPQMAFAHLQQAAQHQAMLTAQSQHQEQVAGQHQADQRHRDQQAASRQQHQDMQKELSQIAKGHPEIDFEGDASQFVGNDPETLKEKAIFDRYQQMKTGQQPGQPQGGQQQVSMGQVFTNAKGERAKIVGFGPDGHPLIERLGEAEPVGVAKGE